MKNEIYDKIRKVRDKMDRGEKPFKLMHDKDVWGRLCASLYTIEDSQSAIDAYCEQRFPTAIGKKYLSLYGLMQALFLQQDSAQGIAVALSGENIDFKLQYPKLHEIRELRNDIVGHPTNRGGKEKSYIQINQMSISKNYFHYCLYRSENDFRFEDKVVDVRSVIEEQRKGIGDILDEICKHLDEEYKSYLKKFEEEKMVEIFQHLSYAKAKALEDMLLDTWGMSAAKEMVDKCKVALAARFGNWENIDSFAYLIKDIEEVYSLAENLPMVNQNSRIRYYLRELFFLKIQDLCDLCQEIDDEFEENLKELEQ